MATYYAGTSNIVLPIANKGLFPTEYQNGSRLTYYASLFNSLEVNSSFYKLPLARTVIKWAAEVHADFRFTFKVWQELTHGRETDPTHMARFMEVVNACPKKGCLLIQFPPKQAIDLVRLETLLEGLAGDWRIAVEFRNRSWYQEAAYQLLDQYGAGMVIHDLPASAPPLRETTADFIYLRFHGPESNYRGSYRDDLLAEYATYIHDWQAHGKTVYAYFNNTLGAALQNLVMINKLILSL
jgi:uncharacterized protein YecE (DUF72 family)